jgi:hypothetical protein
MAYPDVRASIDDALVLCWMPMNLCMGLLWGDPMQPLHQRKVLRLYRTKDEAWADWRRIERELAESRLARELVHS